MHQQRQGQMPLVASTAGTQQNQQQRQRQRQQLQMKPVDEKLLEALGVPELIGRQDLGHTKPNAWRKPVPETAAIAFAKYPGAILSHSSNSTASNSNGSGGEDAIGTTSSSGSSSDVVTSTSNGSSENTGSSSRASTSNTAAGSSSSTQQQQINELLSSKLYLRRAAVLLELCLLQPQVFMQHVCIQLLEHELCCVYQRLLTECSSEAEAAEEYGRLLFGVIAPTSLQQLLPAMHHAVQHALHHEPPDKVELSERLAAAMGVHLSRFLLGKCAPWCT
jgi:hypothetical protein